MNQDNFNKKHLRLILISLLSLFFIYALVAHFLDKKYLEEGNTFYTVAVVNDYLSQGKQGSSVEYSFYLNNEYFVNSNDKGKATENSIYKEFRYETEKMKKLLVGKKFFVKVSEEKPQYNQIYLSKPVAEDFQFVEGQTWKTIPSGAIDN